MKKHLFLWTALVLVIFTGACKKDSGSDTPATDTYPSVIVIDFPTAGTIYLNGTNMNIKGSITDADNLSQARVEIKNKNTNAVLNQQSSSTGTVTFYRYEWNWTVSGIAAPTPATVKIISKDKQGFEISKEVDVTLDN